MTFVGNAQTVEKVFRAFEAEDSTALGRVGDRSVARHGVNAPHALSREKMGEVYGKFWAEFDYEIVGDLHFLPDVILSQLPNGSVNGMFLWEVSRTDKDDSGARSALDLRVF